MISATQSGPEPLLYRGFSLAVFLVALVSLALIGVIAPTSLRAQELPVEHGFAAKVDGKVITLAELNRAIDRRIASARGRVPDEVIEREKGLLRPIVLRELIEKQLLLQRATRDEIILLPGAVEKYLQRTVDQLSRVEGTKYSVDDYLVIWEQQFGESENELRKRLQDEMRIDELRRRNIRSSRSISPKKLREYYRDHPDEFAEDGRISFCQLLIAANDPDYGKMVTEIDAELADFKTAVQFENVVKKWSMGPRQESGGLYNMTESDLDARFPPVPEVVRSLKEGEVSRWFLCRGYSHKIYLVKREAGKALDFTKAQNQIRKTITKKLEDDKRVEFQKSLWRNTTIEIFIPGVVLPIQ